MATSHLTTQQRTRSNRNGSEHLSGRSSLLHLGRRYSWNVATDGWQSKWLRWYGVLNHTSLGVRAYYCPLSQLSVLVM